MRPPLFWIAFNWIRRYVEDRGVPEASLVEQWKTAYAPERKVVRFRNLTVMRDARRKSMVA